MVKLAAAEKSPELEVPEKEAFTVIGALTVDLEKETTPGLQPSIKKRLSLLEPLVAFLSVISNRGGEVRLDFLKNIPLSKLPSKISAIANFIVCCKFGCTGILARNTLVIPSYTI
jgi:hypothetical protein